MLVTMLLAVNCCSGGKRSLFSGAQQHVTAAPIRYLRLCKPIVQVSAATPGAATAASLCSTHGNSSAASAAGLDVATRAVGTLDKRKPKEAQAASMPPMEPNCATVTTSGSRPRKGAVAKAEDRMVRA